MQRERSSVETSLRELNLHSNLDNTGCCYRRSGRRSSSVAAREYSEFSIKGGLKAAERRAEALV